MTASLDVGVLAAALLLWFVLWVGGYIWQRVLRRNAEAWSIDPALAGADPEPVLHARRVSVPPVVALLCGWPDGDRSVWVPAYLLQLQAWALLVWGAGGALLRTRGFPAELWVLLLLPMMSIYPIASRLFPPSNRRRE